MKPDVLFGAICTSCTQVGASGSHYQSNSQAFPCGFGANDFRFWPREKWNRSQTVMSSKLIQKAWYPAISLAFSSKQRERIQRERACYDSYKALANADVFLVVF